MCEGNSLSGFSVTHISLLYQDGGWPLGLVPSIGFAVGLLETNTAVTLKSATDVYCDLKLYCTSITKVEPRPSVKFLSSNTDSGIALSSIIEMPTSFLIPEEFAVVCMKLLIKSLCLTGAEHSQHPLARAGSSTSRPPAIPHN
ncbi:unnamed protein product [Caretta caretta]